MQVKVTRHKGQWKWKIVGTNNRYSFSPPIADTRENRPLAEREAGRVEARLREQVADDSPTLATIFAQYQADKTNNKHAKYAWVALGPFWGHLQMSDITRENCRKYIAQRREKVKDGTIRRELTDLKSAVNWFAKSNPAVFEMPSLPPPRERWLTRDEFAKLYDAAQSDHLRLFLRLAINTAGRKEALLDLRWSKGPGIGYVDFERMQVVLGTGSGNKRRATVPINSVLEAELRAARERAYTDYVIEWRENAVSDIKTAFQAAVERAGIEHCTPHDLRRTAAVWMVQAGHPMEAVAQYLGHSNAAVTYRVYARYQKDFLKSLSETLA